MNLSLTDLITIKEETLKGNGVKVSEIIDNLIKLEREKVTTEIVGKDPLRLAGIRMQLAVANILRTGGKDVLTWWDDLVAAQANLGGQTRASNAEFAEIAALHKIPRSLG